METLKHSQKFAVSGQINEASAMCSNQQYEYIYNQRHLHKRKLRGIRERESDIWHQGQDHVEWYGPVCSTGLLGMCPLMFPEQDVAQVSVT